MSCLLIQKMHFDKLCTQKQMDYFGLMIQGKAKTGECRTYTRSQYASDLKIKRL